MSTLPRAIGDLALAAVRLRLHRYEVAEESMLPALRPGDWVLAVRRPSRVRTGDIVVVDHPDRPGFRLVKRVARREGSRLVLEGDNPTASVDSRSFGSLPASAVLARLVAVYHPPPRRLL